LENSIDEERECGIDVFSTNVEGDDRGGTTWYTYFSGDVIIAESFQVSPSTDIFFVKPIKYANYNFESMIDMYSNLRGSLFLSRNYVSFLILGRFYENKNWKSSFDLLFSETTYNLNMWDQLLRCRIYSDHK